ncbi:MAG: peptide deformylase [Traorella sp.]
MIKEIIKDPILLAQKSLDATIDDMYIIQDLKDTLKAHAHECVGMAANMIGYKKKILIFFDENQMVVMLNPVLLQYSNNAYTAQEGCLSHQGMRTTKRYHKIKVQYQDENMKIKTKTYSGFTAQIIQHEMDHFDGILI